jgi:hypothetical protein
MQLLRSLRATLTMLVLALTLCACSTQPTVTVTKTIVLSPPPDLLQVCIPERVKENTVRALAHGYVVNTYEVWKCNQRIENIQKWILEQQEIHSGTAR